MKTAWPALASEKNRFSEGILTIPRNPLILVERRF
jgi:hypothetical protein